MDTSPSGPILVPQSFPIKVTFVKFFVACQMMAWVGLCIVLLTALISHKVRRHITWYNFCLSWVFYGVSHSLLAFAGQQYSRYPNFTLCLAQATLVYASAVLPAGATLALIIYLWFNLNCMLAHKTVATTRRDLVLVASPYVLCFLVLIMAILEGFRNVDTIQRCYTGAYCVIGVKNRVPAKISAGLVTISMVMGLILQSIVAVHLYRNWKSFRQLGTPSSHHLSMMIRVALFSFLCTLGVIVSLIVFANPDTCVLDAILATLPLFTFLLFGTQMDLVRAWMFWKKVPKASEESFIRRLPG